MNAQLKRRAKKKWQNNRKLPKIKRVIKANFERFYNELIRNLKNFIYQNFIFSKLDNDNISLSKNGYLYLGNIFEYLDERFINKIKKKNPHTFYNEVLNQNNELLKAVNTKAGKIEIDGVGMLDVSCDSKLIKELKPFFKKIYNIISTYYRHENFWLRNSPLLRIDSKKLRLKEPYFSYYHLDGGNRQISIIILLNTTNEKSSLTQVIPSTNNNPRFGYEFITRTSKRFINYAKIKENKFGNKKIYGEIGSAYLIDAGNMLHKGLYGEDRLMLHFNFAQSRSYCEFKSLKDEEVIKFYFHNLKEKRKLF